MNINWLNWTNRIKSEQIETNWNKLNYRLKSIFHNQNISCNQLFTALFWHFFYRLFQTCSKNLWFFKNSNEIRCEKYKNTLIRQWTKKNGTNKRECVCLSCVCYKINLKTSLSMPPIFSWKKNEPLNAWNFINIYYRNTLNTQTIHQFHSLNHLELLHFSLSPIHEMY